MKRQKYLNQLINSKWNGFAKIITGIRRCGKSFLLKELFYEHLISSGEKSENIIILELDDAKNSKYRNPLELNQYILELTKDKKQKFLEFIWTNLMLEDIY